MHEKAEFPATERSTGRRVLRGFAALGIILLGIIITAVLAMGRPAPPQVPEQDQALLVETLSPDPQPVAFTITSRGNVTPRTETTLVAQVSGRIVEVSDDFVPGGFFQAGEVLLRIDPSDYQVAVKRAEAALAGRKAQLASEVARAEQAEKDWRSVGKGTPSDLVLRKPQLAEARAAVTAAEADLERAQRDLERTEISLPYMGLVKSKQVDIGQFVAVGSQLGSSFAVDYAEVRLPLTDRDLAFMDIPTADEQDDESFAGPSVLLKATVAEREQQWLGQIVRSEGVIDPNNRVLYAVARVSDPYNLLSNTHSMPLKIGQFVVASIAGVSMDQLTTLPRHALRGRDNLLVADGDNLLRQRRIDVVRADEAFVYVSGGLEPGDRVILTAVEAPIDGTPIRTPDMLPANNAEAENQAENETESATADAVAGLDSPNASGDAP